MPLVEDLMNPDIDITEKTAKPIIKKKIVKVTAKNSEKDTSKHIEEEEPAQPDDLNLKYQKKSPKEHIKDLPDTYIGSIIKETTNIYTIQERSKSTSNTTGNTDASNTASNTDINMDGNTESISDAGETYNKYRIVTKEIEYVPGLRSIIEEILVNAFDNMNRINQKIATEKKKLKKVTYIKVWTNSETGQITIENDGEGIDVAKHPDKEVYDGYIPQMIFGELLTSGNYNKNEKKITGGKNGYGAKLTNIFSKYFKIETVDRIRKLKYTQEYRDNMDIIGEPVIEDYKEVPYTRISFIPDYPKFSFEGMTDDLEHMIMKRTIDMFACSHGQLEIFYNDMPVKLQTFTDYMKLYLEPDHLVVACKPNDRWEIGACMSPNFTFQQISFVNGINTQRGGKHVEYIVKQITKKMVDLIMKKKKTEVKESFIKDNLMVFVNSTIENPSFDSQTKDTLTTLPRNFGSECNVPDAFIEKLAESGILDRAVALSEFRDSQALKKTDGVKKKRILDIPKLDDAHWAGSKKADQCTLILTEGDSAKAMAIAGISVIPNGHDLYGIYPLRGKLLNTRDKEDILIAQNKEICDIKKILALQEDMEYKDVSTLRYGRIMLMTDSDVDGSHIKGLVINFLSKWPSLMKLTGFVTSLLTPIVKVWKKTDKKGKLNATAFYTLSAFNDWLEANNSGKGYEIKYYKGLGSSTPQEGKEYFRNFKMVTYHWDDAAAATVDMAFNKERADDRKTWLQDYDANTILDINQSSVTISDFINKDLIHFSNDDNHRSIPNIFDGLKPSLRKIMYCCFKRNLRSEIRVAQLAGYVSEHGAYHHGEASLNGAIINLAQNYIGTNNINLLMPEGQFGSRVFNGKDSAAPRYIHTFISKITHILFNKDDQALLTPVIDDGETVEPLFYMPILPIILINGTQGIGTGWSSSIPQFNPLDVISNIRRLMNDQEIQTLTPWYRGFTGHIRRIALNKWLSKGRYKVLDTDSIEITELPIGYSTQTFKELLDTYEKGYKTSETDEKPKRGKATTTTTTSTRKPRWVDFADSTGRLIKSYKNESSDAQVKFTIKFENGVLTKLLSDTDKNGLTELDKIFQMTTSISCNNTMNLYNENNKLMNFKSAEDILKYYYEKRLHYYELRRQHLIKIKAQEVLTISTRARFILDVINEKIKIRNIPKSEVIAQLDKLEYPIMIDGVLVEQDNLTQQQIEDEVGNYDFLISMPIYSLTKEKVEELLKEKEKHIQELETLRQKTDKILWEEDLKIFEIEYKKHMDEFYDYMGIDPKKLETLTIKPVQRKITVTKRSSAAPSTMTSATQSPAASSRASTVTSDNEETDN
jgi:DNA topoisomerase-2